MSPTTSAASVSSPLQEARVGLLIAGTYRLVAELGSGSMGEVYEAEHIRLGKRVAVKLLRRDLLDRRRAVERFRREARAVSAIENEHVVSVFDCGELDDGVPYLVMERLLGEDLKSLLSRLDRLPLRRAVHIAVDACRGLAAVHQAGLVHRDVKPANLFLTQRTSGEELCKLLDFGVAKLVSCEASLPGTLLGTVRYMAPEQLANNASIGPGTDVYAVGAILYQCLTGRTPHGGGTLEELMFEIMTRPAPDVRELCPEVPQELASLIEQALRRDIAQRPGSAAELAAALQAFALPSEVARAVSASDITVGEGSPVRTVSVPLVPKRNRWRSALALGALFAGGLWLGRFTAPTAEGRASEPAASSTSSHSAAALPKVESARNASENSFEQASLVNREGDTSATNPKFDSTPARPATQRNTRPSSVATVPNRPSGLPRFDTKNPYD